MENPKVSVLMAVYNAAKYLDESIRSFKQQTLRDIELICVDDCSTDNSREVLEHLAATDDRIHLLFLDENRGQGHARNEGLKIARGEYIAFLDADDWLSNDALELIVKTFEAHPQTGCVLFDLLLAYPNGKEESYKWHYDTSKTHPEPDGSFMAMSGKQAFLDSLSWGIHGVCAVKADIHRRYPYDESCRWYSDDNTTRIHYYASREVRCSRARYFYRQNDISVTHSIGLGRLDNMTATLSLKRQLTDLCVGQDILNLYEWRRLLILIDTYMFYFRNRNRFTPKDREECVRRIKFVWNGIEVDRLPSEKIHKFGYYPFKGCWMMFRMQEEAYFCLKKILGKMK